MTPTRELALQIFDELRKVGKYHHYSAGLLIGGKSVKDEQKFVNGMNILVATPGRLLQHMDETPGFDCCNLQVLVLDEADRILDMGFARTLNAILENLRNREQTMLFSATQTRSVKDLARLSLRDPEYIAVHAEAVTPTPLKLRQAVAYCEAHEKLDMLWSFVRSHLLSKTICFLSTCKQVKFVFEVFKRLRPGVPLRMLHGKMKQTRRMAVFYEFCEAKEMVLFATDIASRGLDFPSVEWVLQMDCPEDVAQYIHRVGRTARFTSAGHSLLYLTPGEQAMVQQLKDANISLTAIRVNPNKLQAATPAVQALVSKSTELKEIAQRALVSYLRSVFLAPNKAVFDVKNIKVEELSESFGLLTAPKLRFLKKAGKGSAWNMAGSDSGGNGDGQASASDGNASLEDSDAESLGDDDAPGERRAAQHTPQAEGLGKPSRFKVEYDDPLDDDGELLSLRLPEGGEASHQSNAAAEVFPSDAAETKKKKKRMKIRLGSANPHGKRVVFDEDGNAKDPLELLGAGEDSDVDRGSGGAEEREGLDVGVCDNLAARMRKAAEMMRQRDLEDRRMDKLKRREKRLAKKSRARNTDASEDGPVVLGSAAGGEAEPYHTDDSSGDLASEHEEDNPMEKSSAPVLHSPRGYDVPKPDDIDRMSLKDKQAMALEILNRKRR